MQNLSNVNTTLTQLLGKISLIFLIILLLASCKSLQHDTNAHKVTREFDTQYSNSQYEFSYRMGSDYEHLESWDSVKKYMPIKDRKRFSKKMFLTAFKTNNHPSLEHYIFIYPVTEKNKDQKTEKLDSTNNSFEKIYKHPTKNYYIHFYAHAPLKNELPNLINEYTNLFESVKLDKDYNIAQPENPFNLARESFFDKRDSTTNYILPLLKLKYYSKNYQTVKEYGSFVQALATYNSFLYRSKNQDAYLKEFRNLSYYKNIDTTFSSLLVHDNEAINFLVKECSQNQVVMFNEAHFDPQHRLLITHLLEKLYQKGFRFLALEALWETDSLINNRGFVIQSSGLYINEATFADLIRQAHKIGFQIISYDDYTTDREKKQAKNIFEKTIAKDAAAKVLVFAGFGHISEKKAKTDKQRNMMAVEFEILSGINPLTIDQVEYMNMANNWLSIIDTAFDNGFINVDIKIANSFYNFPQQRKEIKYTFSDSIKTELNIERTEYKGSLKVYNLEEWKITKQAVPFQVLAIKDENSVNLFLKSNQEYHLEISDPQGGIIFEENLKVE